MTPRNFVSFGNQPRMPLEDLLLAAYQPCMPLEDLLLAACLTMSSNERLETEMMKLLAISAGWFAVNLAVLPLTGYSYRTGLSEIY